MVETVEAEAEAIVILYTTEGTAIADTSPTLGIGQPTAHTTEAEEEVHQENVFTGDPLIIIVC